jgi:glutathione S-transferase
MIELFQYPPAFNLPSPSPFCLKLELALKLANVRYSNRYDADVRKAPKAKLPYIVIDGTQTIADSDLILRYLKDSGQFTADEWLSDGQRAMCVAISRLVEDHLYWLLVDARWLNDEVWPVLKGTFFAGLPPVVRSIVPGVVRRHVRRTLHGHGLGRHSPQELRWFAEKDLEALDGLLGEQAYMLGERICSVDASVYGMLASIYYPDFETPLKVAALEHPRLAAYCDRITARFFPDYERAQSRRGHS